MTDDERYIGFNSKINDETDFAFFDLLKVDSIQSPIRKFFPIKYHKGKIDYLLTSTYRPIYLTFCKIDSIINIYNYDSENFGFSY